MLLVVIVLGLWVSFFFFFNDPATTEIYPLPLPDALPISPSSDARQALRAADFALHLDSACSPRGSTGRSLEALGVLCRLAAFHDVTLGEENRLQRDPPIRRSPQQELEIHAEVFELLTLRVGHDRPRLRIGLERDSLLVPADRLGLLLQRGDDACERPRLSAQLAGRLVVLVESHLSSSRLGTAQHAKLRRALTDRRPSPE